MKYIVNISFHLFFAFYSNFCTFIYVWCHGHLLLYLLSIYYHATSVKYKCIFVCLLYQIVIEDRIWFLALVSDRLGHCLCSRWFSTFVHQKLFMYTIFHGAIICNMNMHNQNKKASYTSGHLHRLYSHWEASGRSGREGVWEEAMQESVCISTMLSIWLVKGRCYFCLHLRAREYKLIKIFPDMLVSVVMGGYMLVSVVMGGYASLWFDVLAKTEVMN